MTPKSVDQRSELRTCREGEVPSPYPLPAGPLGGQIGSVLAVLAQNSEDWPPSLQKPRTPYQVSQGGLAQTWHSPRGSAPKSRGRLQAVPRCGGQFSSSRTGPKSSRTGPKSSRTGPKSSRTGYKSSRTGLKSSRTGPKCLRTCPKSSRQRGQVASNKVLLEAQPFTGSAALCPGWA